MQVNLNTSINQATPQFKARFSQKDIKTLMSSAKRVVSFEQEVIAKGVELRTRIKPEKAELTANAMYGKLNAILEHVDKLKVKVTSLNKNLYFLENYCLQIELILLFLN